MKWCEIQQRGIWCSVLIAIWMNRRKISIKPILACAGLVLALASANHHYEVKAQELEKKDLDGK